MPKQFYEKGEKQMPIDFRIGHGYDVHRLVPHRALTLGGITVPYEFGLLGHSDADALLHAVMDAILGAIAEGDIGQHFPDSDPRYSGIESTVLLKDVVAIAEARGYTVGNVDATVVAQKPKLMPYIPQMRESIARILRVPLGCVSIKATTEEGLGFTGSLEGIAAHAVVLLKQKEG